MRIDEFAKIIRKQEERLASIEDHLTDAQICRTFDFIDETASSGISQRDIGRFLDANETTDILRVREILVSIYRCVQRKHWTPLEAFRNWDTLQSRNLNSKQLRKGLAELNIKATQHDVDMLIFMLDADGDEELSYPEFLRQMRRMPLLKKRDRHNRSTLTAKIVMNLKKSIAAPVPDSIDQADDCDTGIDEDEGEGEDYELVALQSASVGSICAAFSRLDVLGNGALSFPEVYKAVVLLHPELGDMKKAQPRIWQAYRAADENGNGFVELAEFELLGQHYLTFFHDRAAKIAKLGRACALSLGMSLTLFTEGYESCCEERLTNGQFEGCFKKMNSDGQGVAFNDFCTWAARVQARRLQPSAWGEEPPEPEEDAGSGASSPVEVPTAPTTKASRRRPSVASDASEAPSCISVAASDMSVVPDAQSVHISFDGASSSRTGERSRSVESGRKAGRKPRFKPQTGQAEIMAKVSVIEAAMTRLCQILETEDDAAAVFRRMDKDRSGTLELQELTDALVELGVDLTPDQYGWVFEAVDADASGSIEIQEFLNKVYSGSLDMIRAKFRDASFYEGKDYFRKVFRSDSGGVREKLNLKTFLEAVHSKCKFKPAKKDTRAKDTRAIRSQNSSAEQGARISNMELIRMFEHIDSDRDGYIAVTEFESFVCARNSVRHEVPVIEDTMRRIKKGFQEAGLTKASAVREAMESCTDDGSDELDKEQFTEWIRRSVCSNCVALHNTVRSCITRITPDHTQYIYVCFRASDLI